MVDAVMNDSRNNNVGVCKYNSESSPNNNPVDTSAGLFLSHPDIVEKILQYNRVFVHALTGSGKTTFALNVLPTYGRVLVICSRNSVREMMKSDAKVRKSFTYKVLGNEKATTDLTVATMWDIKKHMKRLVGTIEFSSIVIDEVHCLLADSFADATYYLAKFIEAIPKTVKVIAMSACINWIRSQRIFEGWNYQDYRETCISTKPKKIIMAKPDDLESILQTARPDNRIICYCQSARQAYQLETEYIEKGIPSLAITSQSDVRPKESNITAKEEEELEEVLVKSKKFPDSIHIIFTTSKLREGVEIKDDNVKAVVTELFDSVSLVQVAGRVRHGVEKLIVIVSKRASHLYHGDPYKLDSDAQNKASRRCVDYEYMRNIGRLDKDIFEDLTPMSASMKGPLVEGKYRQFFHNPYWLENEKKIRKEYRDFVKCPPKYLYHVFKCFIEVYIAPIASEVNERYRLDAIVENHIRQFSNLCTNETDKILKQFLREAGLTKKSLGNMLKHHTSYVRVQNSNHRDYSIMKQNNHQDLSPDIDDVA